MSQYCSESRIVESGPKLSVRFWCTSDSERFTEWFCVSGPVLTEHFISDKDVLHYTWQFVRTPAVVQEVTAARRFTVFNFRVYLAVPLLWLSFTHWHSLCILVDVTTARGVSHRWFITVNTALIWVYVPSKQLYEHLIYLAINPIQANSPTVTLYDPVAYACLLSATQSLCEKESRVLY